MGETMLVGGELDALVAENVMGWRLERTGGTGKYRDAMRWVDDRGAVVAEVDWHWKPSIDIADAWQVVEKLRSLGYDVNVLIDAATDVKRPYACEVSRTGWCGSEWESATTAPHAICLAALSVVPTTGERRND